MRLALAAVDMKPSGRVTVCSAPANAPHTGMAAAAARVSSGDVQHNKEYLHHKTTHDKLHSWIEPGKSNDCSDLRNQYTHYEINNK